MVSSHVYMIVNSVTDIHLFDNDKHIRPSIEISYHKCRDVKITVTHDNFHHHYKVEYKKPAETNKDIPNDDTVYTAEIVVRCIPVWNEPCHL